LTVSAAPPPLPGPLGRSRDRRGPRARRTVAGEGPGTNGTDAATGTSAAPSAHWSHAASGWQLGAPV